ncbi:unnamed protein product [Toxocara canis]|uniref:SCP domain-containing protein n=1 Tax=Toxocara canis TaxID=6265 RepID=A0A183UV85_TOXCA|nr:unnamed protein product [Toxocara canis]
MLPPLGQSWPHSVVRLGMCEADCDDVTFANKHLVKSATQLWWSEIGNYSVPAGQPPKPNRQYGQFVQMAWSTTVNVGCGISSGCDRKLFVCLYSPPVDYGREVAYSTGKKSCECTAYKNSKCDHSEQLCIAMNKVEILEVQRACGHGDVCPPLPLQNSGLRQMSINMKAEVAFKKLSSVEEIIAFNKMRHSVRGYEGYWFHNNK